MSNSINIKLYRKRLIPNEMTLLKDDVILYQSDNLIITKWNTLKPRIDIHHGVSAYFLDKGFKISKIYDKNNQLVYWYCDIISTEYLSKTNSFVFLDLLIDVVVYENGFYKVLDLLELSDAMNLSLVTPSQITFALKSLNTLLDIIYNNKFYDYANHINSMEI